MNLCTDCCLTYIESVRVEIPQNSQQFQQESALKLLNIRSLRRLRCDCGSAETKSLSPKTYRGIVWWKSNTVEIRKSAPKVFYFFFSLFLYNVGLETSRPCILTGGRLGSPQIWSKLIATPIETEFSASKKVQLVHFKKNLYSRCVIPQTFELLRMSDHFWSCAHVRSWIG